jgi:hypothetical protein
MAERRQIGAIRPGAIVVKIALQRAAMLDPRLSPPALAPACPPSVPRQPAAPRAVPAYEPEVQAAMRAALRSQPVDWKRITVQDVKEFLMAYCACFMAIIAFFG